MYVQHIYITTVILLTICPIDSAQTKFHVYQHRECFQRLDIWPEGCNICTQAGAESILCLTSCESQEDVTLHVLSYLSISQATFNLF